MKNLFVLFCILICVNFSWAQSLNIQSGKIKLDLKFAPPDSISPQLSISHPNPNLIKGLPVYDKDTFAIISGYASDNQKLSEILVNGKKPDSFVNGKFVINIKLSNGLNNIIVKAVDAKGNITKKTIKIYQDPNADLTPPVIEIASSTKDRGINVVHLVNNKDSIAVNGKIIDKASVYGAWVNNSPLALNNQNEFHLLYANTSDTLHFKAIDNYGNISYKTYIIKKSEGPRPSVVKTDSINTGKYYALIIANQKYHDFNIPNLDFPVKDATSLEKVLEKDYSFDSKNVTFLKNPDRATIIKKLDYLSKKLTRNDNLLIYYAGHGVWEADLQQGFWLPSDATANDKSEWLSNGNIRDYIRGIKSKHTLLIADACFGGAIFKSREVLFNAPKSIKQMYNSPSRRAMTSGTLTAVPDKSVFVKYLVKRLKNNKNKYLPAENLFYKIREAVINNSPTNQTPEYGVIFQAGDEGGGSFIFIHK